LHDCSIERRTQCSSCSFTFTLHHLQFNIEVLLLPDDLHQHPFLPFSIELTIENLLPGTEVELAVRDRDDDLAAHDRPLEVRIGVVFAAVVLVLGNRFVRRKLLEPDLEVLKQAALIVVDEPMR